jgi:hypothetical protein
VGEFTLRPGNRIVIPSTRCTGTGSGGVIRTSSIPTASHHRNLSRIASLYAVRGRAEDLHRRRVRYDRVVVLLATVVRGASFSLMADHPVWPLAGLALTPKTGCRCTSPSFRRPRAA